MSEQKQMNAHVNRGLAWLGMASSLVGALDLIAILIILNTWISKTQYGIATECIWIFPVLDQATDLGLSSAIIQRNDHTPTRISTVFWINTGLSLALLGIIALVAPVVAVRFYGHAIVGWMLIAYGGKLVVQSAYFIPTAMMRRELRYKELSAIRVIANTVEFVTKIGFAATGFGIWCFVLGPCCRTVTYFIALQSRRPYRPRWLFSLTEAKEYVAFGLRTSASQMLFYFYTNIDYPIVGHYFGDAALGLYKLAYEIVLEPVRMISNIVMDVALPTFAKLREDRPALIAQFVAFTRLNLITVMAYSAIVFVASRDVLALLFPEYGAAHDAVRILCAVAVLRAVGFVAPPLLDGVGRPERTLRYMTAAAIVMPLMFIGGAVVLGPRLGFESVAVAWAVGYPVAFAVLIYLTLWTLGWSVGAYVRAVGGVALCMVGATGMALAVLHLLGDASHLIRFLVTTFVVVLGSGFLLAYTQGITLRRALGSLRSPPS